MSFLIEEEDTLSGDVSIDVVRSEPSVDFQEPALSNQYQGLSICDSK